MSWRLSACPACSGPIGRQSRRKLLGLATTAGLSVLGRPSVAQRVRRAGKIDVHFHLDPPGALTRKPDWSLDRMVEDMDRNDVAVGIAYMGPIVTSDIEAGRRRAREVNDFGMRCAADRPGRFGLFASLPLGDVDGSLAEIARASTDLPCDGFGIATSYGADWLGSTRFWPIYEELNRRKAVVFVHPTDAPCCTPEALTYHVPPMTGAWMEWPVNTARTILSLMISGTLRRFPDVRFIVCHGGGVAPALLGRVAGFEGWSAVGPDRLRSMFPDGIGAEYGKFYFECAQAYSPEIFDAVTRLAPVSHILYGSDYDRFSAEHPRGQFQRLVLSPEVRAGIERGNAEALFPRWRAG